MGRNRLLLRWRVAVVLGTAVTAVLPLGAHAEEKTAAPSAAAKRPGLLTEIPFIIRDNWVVLKVRAGKDEIAAAKAPELQFLLDTGASSTILTQEAVEANKLVLTPTDKVRTGENVQGTGDSAGVKITGSVKATLQFVDSSSSLPIPVEIVILPGGKDLRRFHIDGALGTNFFTQVVTEIDYTARIVRLYDPATFAPPSPDTHFVTLPLQFTDLRLPFISADLTPLGFSTTTTRMSLDTGDASAITLFTPFVEKQRWQDVLPRTVPQKFGGVGGRGDAFAGRLKDARIGSVTLSNPLLIFSLAQQGAMASTDTDGQLGGELLKKFHLILDYTHKVFYLRPNASAATPFPNKQYYGFRPLPPITLNGYPIEIVDENSPASRAGIRVGDLLFKIDGKSVGELDYDGLTDLLNAHAGERTFEFGTKDGKERRQVKLTGITY